MASKKVTVKMLKDFEKGIINEEQIKTVFETVTKEAERMKEENITELPNDFISPIDPEKHEDVIYGIGSAVCISLRLACTDAAWKYIAKDFIEKLKSKEEE